LRTKRKAYTANSENERYRNNIIEPLGLIFLSSSYGGSIGTKAIFSVAKVSAKILF